jgi:hypothetical protein
MCFIFCFSPSLSFRFTFEAAVEADRRLHNFQLGAIGRVTNRFITRRSPVDMSSVVPARDRTLAQSRRRSELIERHRGMEFLHA